MDGPLTREQVKAARALLAWSQQELAAAANVATSTVADFERGERTPLGNNAQAIRDALEAMGLEFIAGGVVEKSMLPQPQSPMRAGGLTRWVNATHLSSWGESRDGQGGMPELVSRLIYATMGPAGRLRFPSDESVQFPGWDGKCLAAEKSGPVPAGLSVWEIGSQKSRIPQKAEGDYNKRCRDPLGVDPRTSTFIFLTPQRFPDKDEWAATKTAEGVWRSVQVIDADELVHWIESCPAVAQWLAVKLGRRPEGLSNIEETWAEWISATETPLTEEVTLTDREDDATQILKWLKGPAQLLSIQAEAPDEAVAVLYASISHLPEPYRLSYWGRTVVANDDKTAQHLIGVGMRLIIVLMDPQPSTAQRLVDDGHHVFAAYGPNATPISNTRPLARPWRHNLQLALTRAGLKAEDAYRLARACGRSLPVLRRLMPAAPSFGPTWASSAPPELVAVMLAGAWSDKSALDRKIVGELAGCPYEKLEEILAPFASLGGPLLRSGPYWKVVSLRDLWTQLACKLTPAQLTRFEKVFQKVLGAINPRYDKQPKNKWFETEGEFGDEASGPLRRGLTEALIAIAVFPKRAVLIEDAGARVDRTVRRLFAKADAKLWWSLSDDFHNLAEASPREFLDAVDADLQGDTPQLMSLFRSDEGFMTPTEYLADLLWALEMLALSRDFLMKAALILARLDDLDPGGRWGNRPGRTLRKIFLSWLPQTYATPEDRLKVIDKIVKTMPKIGWRLLVSLAPKHHDTSDDSSKPHWRDFTPDEPEVITWPALAKAAQDIGQRLLDNVDGDGGRWRELLDLWGNFDQTWRGTAVRALDVYCQNLTDRNEILAMREALRQLLLHHRGFATAQWALPEDDLKQLEKVFESLQPDGPEDLYRWLFQPGSHFLRANVDWQQLQAEELDAQADAASKLLETLSPPQIFDFAKTIGLHNAFGIAIARSEQAKAVKLDLLKRGMVSADGIEADVAWGILQGLKQTEPQDWIESLWKQAIAERWGERAELRIVHALPNTAATWEAIESRSASLSESYWKTLHPYKADSGSDPSLVAEKFLMVGRARAAVFWLGHIIDRKPPGELLVRVLNTAVKDKTKLEGNDATMFTHYVGLILDRLEEDDSVSEHELVSLEWAYFQILRYSQRPPKTLHRALARDPQFFAELIKMVFLPDKESGIEDPEPDDRELAQQMARQAYDVLLSWSHVPGASDQGIIDGAALEDWVKKARKILHAAGRGEIGDSKIGEILARAAPVPEQVWPPEPVREIIEMVRSRTLENGFAVGVYNARGVTVRSPLDGGILERDIATNYRKNAEALRFEAERTAACLDRIADSYDADAKREDQSAQRRDWA